MFIYTLTNFESRATVDVDFPMLGLNNDLARMDEIIANILTVDTGNDFVVFETVYRGLHKNALRLFAVLFISANLYTLARAGQVLREV